MKRGAKDDVRARVRRAGGYAPVVYASDKVSKVRELRVLIASGVPREHAEAKLARYRKSLAMLEEAMPGGHLVELLRFELEALDELPPDALRAGVAGLPAQCNGSVELRLTARAITGPGEISSRAKRGQEPSRGVGWSAGFAGFAGFADPPASAGEVGADGF